MVGRLTFLDSAVQDATGTVNLRATISNGDRRFWPGRFVNIRLVLDTVRGERALEATLNGAREISFTILSMTVSLGAVFIPLVFMTGQVGRIFREFAVTIVIAILASGLVSLTLTPLMCARLLSERGHDAGRTWMERVMGAVERRMLGVYGSSLWWSLRHRWISAAVWVVCLAGTVLLLATIPKSFLPPGDSGVIFGVFMGKEGSSPEQMRELQDRVNETLRRDPNVLMNFTMTGATGFVSSNMGITFISVGPPDGRLPIDALAGRMMGGISANPGVMAFLRPLPVLEINTGTTDQNQGQYAFSISGVAPAQVYDVGGKMMEKQINFHLPNITPLAKGLYTLEVVKADGTVSLSEFQVATEAPAPYSANGDGQGVAAAYVQRVRADGTQTVEGIIEPDPATGRWRARD